MVDGSTEAGQAALNTIEGGDKIELVGCAHEPNVCPTAEQLIGCEGFVGEFGPVDDTCADAMAAAGMRIVSNMSMKKHMRRHWKRQRKREKLVWGKMLV